MKKELVLLYILIFALCLPLVCSQTNSSGVSVDKLKEAGNVSDITGKTNDALNQEVQIPENLKFVTRVLFGLNEDEDVTFQSLIISVAVWIFVFLIIKQVVGIMPMFSGVKSWLIAIIIMLLIGISSGFPIYLCGF